jgi:hypothetical protein
MCREQDLCLPRNAGNCAGRKLAKDARKVTLLGRMLVKLGLFNR